MRSSTEKLILAMRALARDIQSGDGLAISEAADRLEELSAVDPAILMMAELIYLQNTYATSWPMYCVQQRRRVHHVDMDYTEEYVWVNDDDDQEASAIEAAGLDAMSSRGRDVGEWKKVGYVDHWEFVTACFTEQGCKLFIESQKHNLTDPRMYVASGSRNREWIDVVELLKSKRKKGD